MKVCTYCDSQLPDDVLVCSQCGNREAGTMSIPWTRFMDMHSGGPCKEKWAYIYIEAPEEEAKLVFYNRFGHNPERVSCTCCGEDYSIDESPTLAKASGYDRGCDWDTETNGYVDRPYTGPYNLNDYCTLADYIKRKDVLVIYAKDIKPKERRGSLPRQGYVWQD